jgi:hypothetical protein
LALDPKTVAELNRIIKILASTGSEVGNKSRELVTLMYAIQQGFVDVGDKMDQVLSDVASGKFEKKNFTAYVKTLGVTKKQLVAIRNIHAEVGKLTDDQIIKARDYGRILDDINSSDRERYDLTTLTLSAFDNMNSQLKQQRKLVDSIGISFGDNAGLINKQIKKHKELSNVFQNEFLPTKEIEDHLSTINDVVDNITGNKFTLEGIGTVSPDEAINVLGTISDEQLRLLQVEADVRKKKLKEFAAYASGKTIDIKTGEIFGKDKFKALSGAALASTDKMLEKMTANYESIVEQAIEHGSLTEELLDGLTDIEKEAVKHLYVITDANQIYEKQLELTKENAKHLLKFRPALSAAEDASRGFANSLKGALDVIPKGLQKILGIENAVADVEASGKKAIGVFKSKLIETGSASEAVGASIKAWGRGISSSVGFLGGFVILLGGLFKLTSSIEGKYKDLAHHLHISTGQAKELYAANLKLVASQKNQFLTLKDISDVQAAYVHATGQVFDLTEKGGQKLAMSLGEMGKAFGYGAETAVEIYEVFSQLGADKKLANKLQAELGFMSEMAGLSPNIIAHDLIESADIVATYFGGMPEAAGRAAIEVRRMGMNLKTAGEISRKMTHGMEGFMTDMFELAAMGGPDLSAAFELGVRGDIEGMTKAIMESIGSLSEFNDMDFLQKEKIAATLGMTSAELGKSLMLREKMAGMSKTEQDIVNSNLASFGNIADMDQQAIRDRIAQVESTQRLTVAWDKIKAVFIKALLPAVESFADMLTGAAPAINAIIWGLGIVAKLVKGISWFVGGMLTPFKTISGIVDGTTEGLEGVLKTLGSIFIAWKLLIKPAFKFVRLLRNGKGIIKSMGAFTKPLGSIFSKIIPKGFMKSLGGIKSKVGELLSMSGGKGGGVSGTVTETLAGTVTEKVKGGKASGMVPEVDLPKATRGADKVKSGMGDNLRNFFSGLGDGLKSMSGTKVLSGALNLIPASIGLVTMIPGVVGAKLISMIDGGRLESGLAGMAKGLSVMGKGKVLVGSLALIAASVGFIAMIPASIGMALLGATAPLAAAGLAVLGPAIATFGGIMMSGAGAVGLIAFVAAAIGLGYALKLAAPAIAAFIPIVETFGTIIRAAFDGLGTVITSIATGFATMMKAVTMERVVAMTAMGPALMSAAAGILAISAAMAGGSIASFFGGRVLDDLESLASIANPLGIASKAIALLGESIRHLTEALAAADFTKLSEFEKLKGIAENVGIGFKMRGGDAGVIQPPSSESTAQNVAVAEPPAPETTAQNVVIKEVPVSTTQESSTTLDPIQQAVSGFGSGGSTKKIELLLGQLINEMRGLNQRPIVVDFGDGTLKTLNQKMKGMNNNR